MTGTGRPTERLQDDEAGIARAAAILAAGGLVAFPTETVYGLGADARSAQAVAAIYAAKGRPHFNPLIVHVADLPAAEEIAVFDERARRLARAFWPGPLTLVLPLRSDAGLAPMISAGGRGSVALRLPAHSAARALLAAFGGPVAAPSANPSGRVSPTRAGHVLEGLGGRIDAVLDGGACTVGLESTIISLDGPARLLRPGGIAPEEIAACLGQPVAERAAVPPAGPEAPGQLASHYAPNADLRLNALSPAAGEVFIGFGAMRGDLNLSPAGDLAEAAANLFATLREADALAGGAARRKAGHAGEGGGGGIAIAPIPDRGIGRAINDRLRRAAAPRPPPDAATDDKPRRMG